MQALPLTDHTKEFNSVRDELVCAPDLVKTNSRTDVIIHVKSDDDKRDTDKIDFEEKEVRMVDRIEEVIKKIDAMIDGLEKTVDQTYRFNSDTDKLCKQFKKESDNINIVCNSIIKVIKTYEKTEPLIYRRYMLAIKERLQRTEQISSKFRKFKFVDDVLNKSYTFDEEATESNGTGLDSELLQKRSLNQKEDIEMKEIIDHREKSIQEISHTMADLHKQYVDIQVMVSMQGESLNMIDDQLIKSMKYVEEGNKELGQALGHKERSDKCKRCVVFTIFIVGVIAIIMVIILKKVGAV